jgi:hypothetical protein
MAQEIPSGSLESDGGSVLSGIVMALRDYYFLFFNYFPVSGHEISELLILVMQ